MNATAILEKLDELGVSIELDGPDIICTPGSKIPDELRPEIREHKREIIGLLHRRTYKRHFPKGTPLDIEYQELVRQVEENGVVLLWSRILKDFVAFYGTEADKAKVPAGFIPYSDRELTTLFAGDVSPEVLRRVHEAKHSGANVIGAWKEASGSPDVMLDSLRKGSEWLRKQHTALYDAPDSVNWDTYTKGLDKWDGLEAPLRQVHHYEGCVLGEGKRCPEDSQPVCQSCAGPK